MRTCIIDGCEAKHLAKGYCRKHYNEIVAGPDRHKVTRNCNECGREYTTTRSNGKYCSLKCRDVVRRREAKARGSAKIPHHKSKFKVWILTCAKFHQQFNADRPGAMYCSTTCRNHAARVRRHGPAAMPAAAWAARDRHCAWCDDVFHSPIPSKIYCSSHCSHCAARARGVYTSGGDWITPARRTRLYQRDSYLCWICGLPTDRTVDPRAHDMAPTLDHVIPRVRGGKDDDANLRCAHRICNALKRDTVLEAVQLNLWTAA